MHKLIGLLQPADLEKKMYPLFQSEVESASKSLLFLLILWLGTNTFVLIGVHRSIENHGIKVD